MISARDVQRTFETWLALAKDEEVLTLADLVHRALQGRGYLCKVMFHRPGTPSAGGWWSGAPVEQLSSPMQELHDERREVQPAAGDPPAAPGDARGASRGACSRRPARGRYRLLHDVLGARQLPDRHGPSHRADQGPAHPLADLVRGPAGGALAQVLQRRGGPGPQLFEVWHTLRHGLMSLLKYPPCPERRSKLIKEEAPP